MHTIFSFGLATGKFSMGSSESLGTPSLDYPETQKSETIILDGSEKADDHVPPMLEGNRKMDALVDEDVFVFTSMNKFFKDVETTIRESMPVDMHPSLYHNVMENARFSPSALMEAQSHLLDNKKNKYGLCWDGQGPHGALS